jgi:hypothetical protein
MAPSAVDNVQQAVEQVTEKVLSTKLGAAETPTKGSKVATQPVSQELPEVNTGHKEPLKLSGALDHLESFDVTPVIGREYVNANLVELLNAPNSDELIRDLAITSTLPTPPTFHFHTIQSILTHQRQSPSAA